MKRSIRDHSLEVRREIVAHLKRDLGVIERVGDRVYNHDRADAVRPFVRYGKPDTTPFEATCLEGSTHRVTLYGFDRGPGDTAVLELGKAISEAMEQFV